MACRCGYFPTAYWHAQMINSQSVFLQGPESGKSIFPHIEILNLINSYAGEIFDHLVPNRTKKCVPGTPRCVRCTSIGIEECSYDLVKKRNVRNLLPPGQACIPCR